MPVPRHNRQSRPPGRLTDPANTLGLAAPHAANAGGSPVRPCQDDEGRAPSQSGQGGSPAAGTRSCSSPTAVPITLTKACGQRSLMASATLSRGLTCPAVPPPASTRWGPAPFPECSWASPGIPFSVLVAVVIRESASFPPCPFRISGPVCGRHHVWLGPNHLQSHPGRSQAGDQGGPSSRHEG